MRHAISIKFAGDGVPLISKVQKKLQDGEKIFFGAVKSFDVERRAGLIACEEVYMNFGVDVYAHQTVLERGGSGPGDLTVFFIHWKGTTPQAVSPMVRLAAECGLNGAMNYALKGWYKGIE